MSAFLRPDELAHKLGVSEAWVSLAAWALPCTRRIHDGKLQGVWLHSLPAWLEAAEPWAKQNERTRKET